MLCLDTNASADDVYQYAGDKDQAVIDADSDAADTASQVLMIKAKQLLMLTQMLMIKDQAVIDADRDDADRSLSEEAGRLVGLGRHHRKQHNLLENNVIDALLLRYFEFSDHP